MCIRDRVTGELDFASPEVTAAAEKMAEIWLNEDYVYGGVASIVSTFIGDSPVPMFACLLYTSRCV